MDAKTQATYYLKLTPLSPIHIGSGREYFPQEYIPQENPDRILIVDLDQLIQKYPRIADQSFLAEQRTPLWETRAGELVLRDASLVLNSDKTDRHTLQDIKASAKRENVSTIWEFTKTAYSRPYIPGSSVKGAVRTAIAYYLLATSPETFSRLKQVIVARNPRIEPGDGSAVEQLVFTDGNGAHDDLMRLWSFSDSSPLDCHKTLTVVQGRRLSSTQPLGFRNWYEALTETSGSLRLCATYDSALASCGAWRPVRPACFPKTIGDIFTCLNRFADDIIAHELAYFRNHPAKPQETVDFYQNLKERRQRGEVLLCLGKGTGWHKKTIGQLLRQDRSSIFKDVVVAYRLGKGRRRFTDFPVSREMAIRNRRPGVFGWAQMSMESRK
ncbi:MAG: type III-A CRISPR-associated RAMP protein Csm5 [candidate division WOR-3 bacterium]